MEQGVWRTEIHPPRPSYTRERCDFNSPCVLGFTKRSTQPVSFDLLAGVFFRFFSLLPLLPGHLLTFPWRRRSAADHFLNGRSSGKPLSVFVGLPEECEHLGRGHCPQLSLPRVAAGCWPFSLRLVFSGCVAVRLVRFLFILLSVCAVSRSCDLMVFITFGKSAAILSAGVASAPFPLLLLGAQLRLR